MTELRTRFVIVLNVVRGRGCHLTSERGMTGVKEIPSHVMITISILSDSIQQ